MDELNREFPDWFLQLNMKIYPKDYTLEQFEKLVQSGYKFEQNGDGSLSIIGRTIIKGSRNTDPLDVSR